MLAGSGSFPGVCPSVGGRNLKGDRMRREGEPQAREERAIVRERERPRCFPGRDGSERIPTREECLELMTRYGMLANIVEHSLKVAEVALIISSALNRKGQHLNLRLVEAACTTSRKRSV